MPDTENAVKGFFAKPGVVSIILYIALTIITSVVSIVYNDAKTRINTLEEKVSFLYQDKVSRAEFREEMSQLRLQNDSNKSDIIARQESMKSDVLARIDLIINNSPRR